MMIKYNETITVTPPPLIPASVPHVHFSITIAFITLYSLLFLVVYVELWMILYYRHRRISFQTVFLYLCLFWAGLRTTLFSFYFKNTSTANYLCTFLYWLLYCFPVCLQFFTLCLLVLFFTKISFRARPELYRYKNGLHLSTFISMIVFLLTNITCAVITKQHEQNGDSTPFGIVLTRVVINDLLFIVYGLLLSVSIIKMSKLSSVHQVMESLGTTKFQAIVACVFIIPLYISRAVYNLIAISDEKILSFGYSWINVSDQVDNGKPDTGTGYVSFGIVLFVWEFLPTAILVVFFRVKVLSNQMQMLPSAGGGAYSSGAYFFDNPRRYDSDDDVDHNVQSRNSVQDSLNPRLINATQVEPRHLESMVQGTPPPILYTSTDSHTLPIANQPSIQHYYDGT